MRKEHTSLIEPSALLGLDIEQYTCGIVFTDDTLKTYLVVDEEPGRIRRRGADIHLLYTLIRKGKQTPEQAAHIGLWSLTHEPIPVDEYEWRFFRDEERWCSKQRTLEHFGYCVIPPAYQKWRKSGILAEMDDEKFHDRLLRGQIDVRLAYLLPLARDHYERHKHNALLKLQGEKDL